MARRSERPITFRFTAVRRSVIEHLLDFRYLRTTDFYALLRCDTRATDRAVRRLLTDLVKHRLVCRRVVPSGQGQPQPNYEFAYWLSGRGRSFAVRHGVPGADECAARRESSRGLEHELAITDFHLGARNFAAANSLELYWQQCALRRGVNPDALFAVTDPKKVAGEGTSYFFLEVERSVLSGYSHGRPSLIRRLERYAEYQGTDACRDDWIWFDEFRVVVVVRSEARREQLITRLQVDLALPMFWIAVEGRELSTVAFRSPAGDPSRRFSLFD